MKQIELQLDEQEQQELSLAAEACGLSVDDLMAVTLSRLLKDVKEHHPELVEC
jgi:hypothetical protein